MNAEGESSEGGDVWDKSAGARKVPEGSLQPSTSPHGQLPLLLSAIQEGRQEKQTLWGGRVALTKNISRLILILLSNWLQRDGDLNWKKLSYLEVTWLVFISIISETGVRDQAEFKYEKRSQYFLHLTCNCDVKPATEYLEEVFRVLRKINGL